MSLSHRELPFSEADLVSISKCLDSAATHRELDSLFRDVGLREPIVSSGLSKWQRISNALAHAQNQTQTGNLAMKLIQTVLAPKRFLERPAEFDEFRRRVNQFLAFRGWDLLGTGKFGCVSQASTIEEARARADRLRLELERRHVHPDVLRFCTAELVQQNYLYAVLEATKRVSDKLRDKTGLPGDAAALAHEALMPGKDSAPKLSQCGAAG